MQARRAARLLHRLGWCLIMAFALGGPDRTYVFALPAAVLSAHWLQRLGELVDHRPARRLLMWSSVAAGATAMAALWHWIDLREGRPALWSATTVTVSLYALGLASWVAHHGGRSLARRLQLSVLVWSFGGVSSMVLYATGDPFDPADSHLQNTTILDRAVDGTAMWITFVPMVAAAGLLIAGQHGVRRTFVEVAQEDEAAAREVELGASAANEEG